MTLIATVRLVNIVKQFGRHRAVDDVSLTIPDGCFVTLLGPSGCGKTTTLRMIAGFIDPDAGDIYIGEERVNHLPSHRRGTAMVFQEYALFPHMTVMDNVAYGLRRRRVPRADIARRVESLLDLMGLEGLADRYPHQLSGGQQQRVALARALAVEPEVLLLDEPLSNLDAKLRVRVRTEIRRLQQQLGKTVVYVTHDQEEALSISDQVAVMERGRVVQLGTPAEIYHRPINRFVADFVGLANIFEGTMVAPDRVRVGSVELHLAAPGAGKSPGEKVGLVVRPEAIALTPALAGGNGDGPGVSPGPGTGNGPAPEEVGAARNRFRGEVVGKSFLGAWVRYWVRVGDGEWLVDAPGAMEPVASRYVDLTIPEDRIHLLAEGP